jgi:single-strand DNA-binding protein
VTGFRVSIRGFEKYLLEVFWVGVFCHTPSVGLFMSFLLATHCLPSAVSEALTQSVVLFGLSGRRSVCGSPFPRNEEYPMNTTITIVGNVTRDPELRFTASGVATSTFTLAVNRKVNTRNGTSPTEVVSFFTVVAWNTLAENACVSLTKGSRVVVSGRLEQRSWQTPAGEKRTVYELVADEIGASLRFASAAIERNQRQTPTIDDVRGIVFDGSESSPNTEGEFVANASSLIAEGREELDHRQLVTAG